MKKSLAISLAALMLLGFAGCKKQEASAPETPVVEPAVPAEAAPAPEAAPVDPAAIAGALPDMMPAPVPAPADVAAPPADALKTESGVAYKKLVVNEAGAAVSADSIVKMHYTGWTTDGKMFDTSTGDEPVTFSLGSLIPGMKDGLMVGKKGEKVRVWIPEELAYKGREGSPQGMLVFDFEIVDVIDFVMPPKDVPSDAVKLENGLAYRIVKTTPDAKAISENDLVSLDFTGWTQKDGNRFQSSIELGEPLAAPVNSMFPGWKNILPKVHAGDEVEMWVPQELGISPDGELEGTLIFRVNINSVTALPKAPADVAAPGADTQKTESGIAWRILTPGTGTEHPKAEDQVKVHYSGWTTDGVMFDSSVARGEPITFPLNAVIPGWSEAVQLMVVGEKRLVWIPEELAYKGQPGAPAGMLVFEIELLEIVK